MNALINMRFIFLMILLLSCLRQNHYLNDIELINQNGKTISWMEFKNYYKLVFFGYLTCPDICPVAIRTMDQTKNIVKNLNIKLIFITIDPERDTPAIIKTYVSNFQNPIIGLTGDKNNLEKLYKYFNISFKKQHAHNNHSVYGYDHTPFIYFLDTNNTILKAYPTGIKAETLAKEIQKYLNGN